MTRKNKKYDKDKNINTIQIHKYVKIDINKKNINFYIASKI